MAYCVVADIVLAAPGVVQIRVDEPVVRGTWDDALDLLQEEYAYVSDLLYINDTLGKGPESPDYTKTTHYALYSDSSSPYDGVTWEAASHPNDGVTYYVTLKKYTVPSTTLQDYIDTYATAIIQQQLCDRYSAATLALAPIVKLIAIELSVIRTGQQYPAMFSNAELAWVGPRRQAVLKYLDQLAKGHRRLINAAGNPMSSREANLIYSTHSGFCPTFGPDDPTQWDVDPDLLDKWGEARLA